MELKDLLGNPIFGFITTILSIIIGIIVSHLYYKRGKCEGEAAASETKKHLFEARQEISELTMQLKTRDEKLMVLGTENNKRSSDIEDILNTRTFNESKSDYEILSQFVTLYQAGKTKEAEKYFIAKKNDVKDERLVSYMEAFVKLHYLKYSEAINLFDASSACTSTQIQFYSLFNSGQIYYENLKDDEIALQYFNKAFEIDPTHTACLNGIAGCYIKLHQYELAKEKLDIALGISPYDATTHTFLTMYYLWTRQYEKTIESGQKAIEMGASGVQCASFIGDASLELKDYDRAIENYKKVLDHGIDNPVVLNNLICCYLDKDDYLSAERGCKLFLQHFPDLFHEIFDKYGTILLSEGKAQEVTNLAKGIDFFKDVKRNAYSLRILGYAYFELQEFEKGRECFEAALLVEPTMIDALSGMGVYFMYSSEKNLDKAKEYLDKAYAEMPGNFRTLKEVAVLYMMKEEYPKAIDVCNEALKIDENRVTFKSIRGQAMHQLAINQSTFYVEKQS